MGEVLSTKRELVLPQSDEELDSILGDQAQHLWLSLAKREWASLVVLPAHPGGSTRELASELADAGTNLGDIPVAAITASELDASSARALIALARQVSGRQKRLRQGHDVIDVESEPSAGESRDAGYFEAPTGQLIISIPSIDSGPSALAVASASDLVVIGVELNKTSMKELSRSIELIGRERIAGCVLL